MAGSDRYASFSDKDLCEHLKEVEDTYGLRIRVALVPLSKGSGKSTHAVTATAYHPNGKRVSELESTQCYFPGNTSKTFAGAAFYVCNQLEGIIDEWQARRRREEEQWEPGELTPLEQYIAGSFSS